MTVHFRVLLTVLLIGLSGVLPAAEVIVPFVSGEADIVSTAEGSVLRLSGFTGFGLPGDPALPFVEAHVLLPPGAKMKTLRIELRNVAEQEVKGSFSIAPSPPPVISENSKIIEDWRGRRIRDKRNVDIYDKNDLFPAGYVTTGHASKLGRYLLLPVRFWPYRYNPVSGKLMHLVKADVAITFDAVPVKEKPSRADKDMMPRLSELAVNWQQADEWYSSSGLLPAEAAATSGTPLAIITTSSIVSSSTKLAEFVTHKTNMGFDVTVVTNVATSSGGWGGGTGNTAAENIRAWLQANYATKAHYAILIGSPHPSTGTVPMKMLWPRHGAGDGYENCPSDYYYADLTGNWDLDGDGFYGEEVGDFGESGVDRIPEVIIGRIPYYGTVADLDKILQKIITYESAPDVGSWAQRVLIAQKPLDNITPTWESGEALKNDVCKPAGLGYYRVYESDFGLMPPPEMTPCTYSNVKNEWMNGYGFVFWGTHGGNQVATDVFNILLCYLLNDSRPAFTFQGSCNNGYPEVNDNLGYKLLANGAIGTVSASRVSWYYAYEESEEHSEIPSETDCIFGMNYRYALRLARDRERCGDALFDMKTSLDPVIWMNHLVFNLYGDPTVAPRWTTSPLAVETELLDAGRLGQHYERDLQSSGGALPYAWSVESGSLPLGLTLSSSGVVSGIPRNSGVYSFTVRVTDDAGNYAIKDLSLEISLTAYSFEPDSDPGWTCQGGWALGRPVGNPSCGYTGNWVYGYDLNGDYPNNMASAEYLTTRAIDCSSLIRTKLTFRRMIGVQGAPYDFATVQASNNGTDWMTIWSNPATVVLDSAWTQVTYDISYVADGSPTVYIRWGVGPTDSTTTYSGWNIDDVAIEGVLTKPLIRHTPISRTDITSGSYLIAADVYSSHDLLPEDPTLHWKTGSGVFSEVKMAWVSGSVHQASIPAQPSGTTVSYYISAADPSGSALSPSAAPVALYRFDVLFDDQPPVILHTPLPNTADAPGYYRIDAVVTDNVGVGAVTLTWSRNGGSPVTEEMVALDGPGRYSADIASQALSGDWYCYRIAALDIAQAPLQASSPPVGWHMFSILPEQTRIYVHTLDSDPGWTCDTGWAFGKPTGRGSGAGDPASGYTNSFVYGYNLSGDYQNSIAAPGYLTTEAIDCGGASNVTLKFRRWLGVEGRAKDSADIQASSGGGLWTNIWSNPESDLMDLSWTQAAYDISSVADGKPAVYIRWGIGPTNSTVTYPGWNIDDVEIWADLYVPVDSISSLKAASDYTQVEIRGHVVTAAFHGFFYVQKPDEYQGIRVAWPEAVVEGSPVVVRGMMRTRCGERELVAREVTSDQCEGSVSPVGIGLKMLGGSAFDGQQSVDGGTGLNNIGTLVKAWGRVTEIGDGYFYIDDGSGLNDGTLTGSTPNAGVRVLDQGTGLNFGQFVTVVGISTGFINEGRFIRAVLPKNVE